MKPFFRSAIVTFKIYWQKLILRKNVSIDGVSLLGYNTKIVISTNGILKLGKRVVSDGRFTVSVGQNAEVNIGSHVYFNENCMISSKSGVYIGADCKFGPGVKIFDNNHKFSKEKGVSSELTSSPISIGENTWIGSNSVILKGAKIGKNCVIGAGCVIKENIPDGHIVTQKNNLIIKQIENR